MINEIIDSVCLTINSVFGDCYEIYTENIKQGLKRPCFFVFCLKPTNDRFLGDRFHWSVPLCIQFFPKSHEKQSECNEVFETLSNCLEVIQVNNGGMRGSSISCESTDEVLSFFITYSFFSLNKPEIDSMGELTQTTEARRDIDG